MPRAVLACLLAVLFLAVPARAAQPLAAVDLTTPQEPGSAACDPAAFERQPGSGGVDVASNAAGDTLVSWTRSDGLGGQLVQAAFRPAGGTFGAPQTIGATRPCYSFAIFGPTPEVGLDEQGNAAIVFAAPAAGGNTVVRAALRPAGGAFGTPVDLASGTAVEDPRLAMGANGAVVAAWSRTSGGRAVVQAASRAAGGVFGAAESLSDPAVDARETAVALNASGAAVVAWLRTDGNATPRDVVLARVRPQGQNGFAAVRDLSTGLNAIAPHVAIDPAGRATAVWNSNGADTRVQSRALSAAGTVAAGVDDISERGSSATSADVAVDDAGTAIAIFKNCPLGRSCTAQAAVRPANGGFGAPVSISPPNNDLTTLRVAVDPAGTATAVVAGGLAAGPALVTRRPPGGSFGAVETISPPGLSAFAPRLAVDGEGNAVVGWTAGSEALTGAKRPQAAAFDGAAPSLGAVDVPAGATAGRAAHLHAAASDRWSGAAISWSLGDGTGASGADVDHAYAAPGVYTVTATATDGAGNTSSATRAIQVGDRDDDGDGFPAGQDCADGDPGRHPGAAEVRGDGIDQNCDGADQGLPRIGSAVQSRWAVSGARLFALRLRVAGPPAGARARLACLGKRCPFKQRTVTKVRKRALTLFKDLRPGRAARARGRRFRAGQTLELRITAPGFIGKVVRFPLRRGRIPNGRILCLPPGAKRPRAC